MDFLSTIPGIILLVYGAYLAWDTSRERNKLIQKIDNFYNSGAGLILLERAEQIEVHKRKIETDVEQNFHLQLRYAAIGLLNPHLDERIAAIPFDWNPDIWVKMCKKDYKQRLVIAGALIAAEIDRISFEPGEDEDQSDYD